MSPTQRAEFIAACNIERLRAIRYWRDADWQVGDRLATLEAVSAHA